jgi:myosin heavy subunit
METQEKDKKSKLFLYVVIGILLLTNGLLAYKLYKGNQDNLNLTSQNVSLNDEKANLQSELANLATELEATKSSEAQKDEEISALQVQLEGKVAQLRKALNSKSLSSKEIKKLKAEIDQLRKDNSVFQDKIRALEDELAVTTANLNQTTSQLTEEKKVTQQLNKTVEAKEAVIEKGKQLIADQISVTGIKLRRNGKEKSTTKNNKTDAIKATFRILENKIADAGDKALYVKITGPDGVTLEPLTGADGVFKLQGGAQAKYTVMKIVDYNNTDQVVSVYHKKGSDYAEGIYTVEIFADRVSIGKSSVTLK